MNELSDPNPFRAWVRTLLPPRLSLPVALAFLVTVILAHTGKLSAQTADFDTPGDLANDFVINGSTGNFAQVASGGITGGAVDVLTNNASDTAIFKTAVASGAGQTVSTSIFFRYDSSLRDFTHDRTPIQLGFAISTTVATSPADPNVGLDAGVHIQALSGSGQMRFVCTAGSNAQTFYAFTNLLDGHWYRFILDLTITGNGDNALNFKTYLQDCGTNGQTPAARRIVGTATLNSATVTQAAQLYAGFYAQKDGGTDLLDNFSVMNGATPTMGADLALVVTADRDPVALNRDVTYTATVTNNGPVDSAEVFYEADLPPGEAYEILTCDQACFPDISGPSVSVSLGAIAPGASRQVYLRARVLAEGPLTLDSYVRATAVEDDFPQNNSVSVTTHVIPAPPAPSFSATVASSTITLGQSTRDSASLSGANPTGEISFTIYGPNDPGCSSISPIRSSVTVHGNGIYSSDSFTPSAAGTYRYIASYHGDDYNADVIGQCGDPGQTVMVSPAATPTPTPSASPSPSPSPRPPVLGNISTRLSVQTDDNVLIGGFIVTGTESKRLLVRARGPSLGVPGNLANPTLELYGPSGLLASNDNWQDAPNRQEIIDSTVAPTNDLESAILMTLPSNRTGYTAIVRGANRTTGVASVEIYELDTTGDAKLANVSSRGFVQTGDNVMIGGFIISGTTSKKVIIRAVGPSLSVPGKLADPTLELFDRNGVSIAANDNWRSDQEAEIIASTVPPSDDHEAAIVATLPPTPHTAIVRGKDGATGVALIEVFALN